MGNTSAYLCCVLIEEECSRTLCLRDRKAKEALSHGIYRGGKSKDKTFP